MLHPVSVAAKKVLEVDHIQVLTDGGYSNAEEIARCEREGIEVAAPIKRGAMNSITSGRPSSSTPTPATPSAVRPERPFVRLVYTPGTGRSDIALRPAELQVEAAMLRPGVQRTIHRLVDQGALDRMEARIYADPSLMTIRRCTVEHPFGTIKRMSGGEGSSPGGLGR